MPSRNLTEILLTRAVGHARAEAIAGDLLELAATRGRLWYYAASFGTFISFTWRFPAALLSGFLGFLAPLFLLFWNHSRPPLAHAWDKHPYVAAILERALLDLASAVLFAAVNYRVRDRIFRLALAACAAAASVFFCIDILIPMHAVVALGALAVGCLFVSANWRAAFLVVALATAAGVLFDLNFGNLAHLGCWVYWHKPLDPRSHFNYFEQDYAFPYALFWTVTWTRAILDTLVLCFACSRLRRLLLRSSKNFEAV